MADRPLFAWSYSGLTMYENCPRKYWAVKIKKVSDLNRFNIAGDEDHQAIERTMAKGFALPEHLKGLLPVVQKLKQAPGEQYVEYKLCLNDQLVPVPYKDWNNAWVRGAGDYIKVNGEMATYIDWKSGKPRDEVEDQIDLTALLLFPHFPQVKRVQAGLYYYNHGKMAMHAVERTDAPRLWNGFFERLKPMTESYQTDSWPATPNPLCGWCPYTDCPHNKSEERKAREAARGQG